MPPRPQPSVRVGLLVDTSTVELSSPSGLVFREAASNRELARGGPGGRWTVRPGGPGGGLSGELQGGGPGGRFSLSGSVLAESVDTALLSVGNRRYRGTIVVRPTPRGITVVNTVPIEEYLLGVVPREIGRVGPDLLEASKAQAVAARTYTVGNMNGRAALGFDLFATVQDQVYGGASDEHAPVSRAVVETFGEILTHRGQPIQAYYHSTCAGQTAAINEVWDRPAMPYLVSVRDINPSTGVAYDSFSSRFRWTQRWTGPEMQRILERTLADSVRPGRKIGALQQMRVLERTRSGRVRRMEIVTSAGRFLVGKDRVRWILPTPAGVPLNSSKFNIQVNRGESGEVSEVIATGGGWGHGIGMCQVGAMGRARTGQDYRQILSAYYSGTKLERQY